MLESQEHIDLSDGEKEWPGIAGTQRELFVFAKQICAVHLFMWTVLKQT